jgi:hypothetical protein
MLVSDIEHQDKSVYNEERAQAQHYEYSRKIKIVEDRGISREEAELVYLQQEG